MIIEDKPNLNPGDFSGYGEEMIEMVDNVNQAVAENKQLKEELDIALGNIAQVSKNTLLDHLDKAVPDWETINKDPAFLNWLGQVDPLTGIRRQALLDDAYAALDAPCVANFFLTFTGDGGRPTKKEVIQTEKDKGHEVTTEQFNKAVHDAQTGRMTQEEFQKIADQYQGQLMPGTQRNTITGEEFQRAVKDAQTGRITEEEFEKIANRYQRQQVGGP